jgi:hypothetical protein
LSSITARLENCLPQEEKDKIITTLEGGQITNLPEDEEKRAAYLLNISRYFIDPAYEGNLFQKLTVIFNESKYQDDADEYTEQLFLPLYHYYDERIDDIDLLLYLLLKYKRLSEWFDRDRLFNLAMEDSSKKEAALDSSLRRFLLQEGFDYPFSTPSTPKGRTDIVVHIEEKPLPLEIKLFDGDTYGKSYLKKGFNQALQYAEDYHQPTGYLIVFNLSEKLLQFGKNASDDYFPMIKVQNKNIFIIPINIHPVTMTASQEKEPRIVLIEEEYLVSHEIERVK